MIKFKSKVWDFLAVGTIGIIVFLIYLTNFRGNFWISGWDNLHPEFNFAANLGRAVFSAWQEYQGLGLPAGHGHTTEALRELILWLVNIFLPVVSIRKIYLLSMLLTGSLGVYFFIRNVILTKIHYTLRVILSFIAGSLYLLNLATVQIFYIPYEAFAACFAFLPWMVYSIYFFMHHPTRKNFLLFLIIQLLGTWQFYIPTLFIVYFVIAAVVGASLAWQDKSYGAWKTFLVLLISIVIINSYWLLPFAYYTLTNLGSQQQAYVNFLYTKDAYTENANFGNLQNATLFKSFLFDNVSYTVNRGYDYMLSAWRSYANHWYFNLIGYSIFTISIWGIIQSLRKKKHLTLACLFIIFFGLLAIQIFPFNLINDFIRSSPLLDQVFRNPFTKFANAALFLIIIFFTLGLLEIIEAIQANPVKQIENKLLIPLATLLVYFVLINIYILPLWQGNFIYAPLKLNIPKEYFQTFNYFANQKAGRIANLPQFTSNGWDYYKWGYLGSGFIWYGINQPILDRAFDVWSRFDENYYWEISQAIYSENLSLFEKILDKYQINWLLVDENITTPGTPKILYTDKIEKMLAQSSKVKLAQQFGKIKIYQANLSDSPQNFVFTTNALPNVEPIFTWNNRDQGFLDYGNYLSNGYDKSNLNVFYPIRSLFTGREQKDIEFNLKEDKNNFIFETKIPKQFYDSVLQIPAISKEESTEIDKNNLSKTTAKYPTIMINDNPLKLTDPSSPNSIQLKLNEQKDYFLKIIVPKIYGYYGSPSVTSSGLKSIKPASCNQFNQGSLSVDQVKDAGAILKLISIHSNNCFGFDLTNLSQNLAYLVSIPAKNVQGRSLFVAIVNDNSKREDLASYLPETNKFTTSYFVIPPKEKYGLGLAIHLDNQSLSQTKTVNELGEIKISPLPYNYLSSIKLVAGNNSNSQQLTNLTVNHPSPDFYEVTDLSQSQYLVLSQAYDSGWHAYYITSENLLTKIFPFLFASELKNHLLINNWENGWKLTEQKAGTEIVLVYLPQYFEYLGLAMLILTFFTPILAILASKLRQ